MELSGQFQAPATLLGGSGPGILRTEGLVASDPVWMRWRRDKNLFPPAHRTSVERPL